MSLVKDIMNRKIDSFLLSDYLKSYRNTTKRVGFVVPKIDTYDKVMSSTRIRCYDIINYLNKKDILSELYKENKEYKIVVFQKAFDQKHIALARRLNDKGCTTIFDINVNYLEKKGGAIDYILEKQTINVKKMIKISSTVIVPTQYLFNVYSKYSNNISLIEESIPDDFFKTKKKHLQESQINLLYVGYAIKANELSLIKKALQSLHREFGVKLLLICEEDPKLDIIPYEFRRYDQKKIPKLILEGDIKIAPRDLSNSYNLGHTFTKIAYPMAIGLPVVASPVPSYKDRVAILCEDEDCWYEEVKGLIESAERRERLGNSGRRFVMDTFNIRKIGKQYIELFKQHLNEE